MADRMHPQPLFAPGMSDALRLLESVGLDRHLVARCTAPGCGRIASCDPTPWVAEGLGALPLRSFSPRLRCVCGNRQAAIEVWPGQLEPERHPDLYVFR